MTLSNLITRISAVLSDNAPTILSGVAVTTSIATAVLSAQGAIKATKILENEEHRRENYVVDAEPMTFKDKVQLVYPVYIPAAVTGITCVSCIIAANRIGTRRAAAMAAAYALSRDAFVEYKDKVVEKFGRTQETKVRDEIAQDQVTKNQNSREIIISGPHEVMCYDSITGRYFKSNVESLRKAQNDVNKIVLTDMSAPLSLFYDLVGLSQTPYSEEIGFNTDHQLELVFSTVLAEDGTPCLSINYETYPIRNFW